MTISYDNTTETIWADPNTREFILKSYLNQMRI